MFIVIYLIREEKINMIKVLCLFVRNVKCEENNKDERNVFVISDSSTQSRRRRRHRCRRLSHVISKHTYAHVLI